MLPTILAILLTLLHASITLRLARVRSMGVPVLLIGTASACAAAGAFWGGGPRLSPAMLIVAPVVLAGMISALWVVRSARTGAAIWPGAVLVTVLGAMAMIDRVDALSAQLLMLLGLTIAWMSTLTMPETEPEASPDVIDRQAWGRRAAATGVLVAFALGWMIFAGASALLALALIATNLIVWALSRRDFGAVCTALLVGVCVGVGMANVVRIFGGASRQPEWGGGMGGGFSESIAYELMGRPYLPGFSGMLPDVLGLVLALLIVVLATEESTTARRRRVLAVLLGVLVLGQAAWMVIGSR